MAYDPHQLERLKLTSSTPYWQNGVIIRRKPALSDYDRMLPVDRYIKRNERYRLMRMRALLEK